LSRIIVSGPLQHNQAAATPCAAGCTDSTLCGRCRWWLGGVSLPPPAALLGMLAAGFFLRNLPGELLHA